MSASETRGITCTDGRGQGRGKARSYEAHRSTCWGFAARGGVESGYGLMHLCMCSRDGM